MQATPLVGRDREIEAIRAVWSLGVRLLTLTGPPGIGKSRLAVELAAAPERAEYEVAFVDLAPVVEAGHVPSAIAQALSVRESPDQSALERVAETLGDRPLLLVLDNFEHVLDAAPDVGTLLAACRSLTVLVTSRVPLHLSWEREFAVPPLALPDPSALPAAAALELVPAVTLFAARARAVLPDFAITDGNARVVAEICCRLDGMPLAIELAAPRVKLMPPQMLLERLHHRLSFLQRIGRDLPARHQTLRAAIGWSYALLQPAEQTLLRRLATFVGGFTIDAAETVCWSADEPSQALDTLDALVDASLLSRDATSDEPRLRMLETVREFAAEQLTAAGEMLRTQRHHAAYFLAMAELAESRLHGPEEGQWLRWLEREHDNVRAALGWMLHAGEPRAAMRIAVAVWWCWYARGHLTEARRWLEAVLHTDTPDDDLRARAMHALGVFAWRQGDFDRAAGLAADCLRLSRQMGYAWGAATALFLLEMVARSRGDYAAATTLLEDSLALFRQTEDNWGIATALLNLGTVLRMRGENARSAAAHAESLALFRQVRDASGIAASLYSLGVLARESGDARRASELAAEALAAARTLEDPSRVAFALHLQGLVERDRGNYVAAAATHREELALFQQIGDTWGIAYSLGSLGTVARLGGDFAAADERFRESLTLRRKYGDRWGISECLEGLAITAAECRQGESAARLFGAAEAIRQELGTPLGVLDATEHERAVGVARSAAGKRRFDAELAAGRTAPLAQIIEEAVRPAGGLGPGSARSVAGRPASPLSPREAEVARMIAQGHTNAEIAAALYVTHGTVATHVGHILSKLGFQSRTQIAAWAAKSL